MNATSVLRSGPRLHSASTLCRPCLRRYLQTSRSSQVSKPVPVVPFRPRKLPYTAVPASSYKPFTEAELAELRKLYTPEQMAAIQAGEEAIDPKDLAEQTQLRTNDPWLPDYQDDFSKHDLVIDKPLRAPEENYDPNLRFKTTEEIENDYAQWIMDLPEDAALEDYSKFEENFRLTVGKEGAERNPIHYFSPPIPKHVPGLAEYADSAQGAGLDESPEIQRLVQSTGFDARYIRSLRTKTMIVKFVTNQTNLGKITSMFVLTIVGDGKGMLGVGTGKSAEAADAKKASFVSAVRSMQPVPRYENRTIYGDVKAKVGGCVVELYNRPPGEPFILSLAPGRAKILTK